MRRAADMICAPACALVFFAGAGRVAAASTIDATNRYAWGANIGWADGVADTDNGAVIGEYVCSGYIYSANVGWINLGSGSPANGIRYQNNSGADFGVNNDGLGNLSGYAYGENIGWIAFETNGAPKINLVTGVLSGSVYSANCGWISLSNSVAYVQTDSLYPGPLDTNGLPIPWELSNFGTIGVNPNADPNGSGMTVAQDYVAGTDPNNPASVLKITSCHAARSAGGESVTLTWSSELSRLYYIERSASLGAPSWTDSGLGLISPDGASTTRVLPTDPSGSRFYRVRVVLPPGE
jgi:hypothetical protein